MAQRTVLVWNIEDFGSEKQVAIRQDKQVIRINFIALLAQVTNADIIVIQECTQNALPLLAQICAILGPNWSFDHLPAAIDPNYSINWLGNRPLTYQNLMYDYSHHEGYAVLYRNGRLNVIPNSCSFLTSLNPPQPGYISLCTTGATAMYQGQGVPHLVPSYTGAVGGPLPGDFHRPALFPIAQPNPGGTPSNGLIFTHVRRPCLLNISGTRTSVDLIVYHAPVDAVHGAQFGTACCGLLTEIQKRNPAGVYRNPNVIVAGDFNIIGNQLNHAFLNFYNCNMTLGTPAPNQMPAQGQVPLGITPIKVGNNGYQSSVVHFSSGPGIHGNLTHSDVPDHFYGNARDQIFYRFDYNVTASLNIPGCIPQNNGPALLPPPAIRPNPNNNQQRQISGVIDIMDQLIVNTDQLQTRIAGCQAIENSLQNTRTDFNNGPMHPGHLITNGTNAWLNIMEFFGFALTQQQQQQQQNNQFSDELTAAIFYRLFISDHAPLIITFDA